MEITPAQFNALVEKYESKGRPGYKFLIERLDKFEREKNLEKTELNLNKVNKLFMNGFQTFDLKEWERLNAVIDSLPEAKAPLIIPVTPEMLADLRRKRAERGNYGAVVLFNFSEKGNSPVKLSVNYIARMIFEGSRIESTNEDQWKRLNEVLDELLDIDLHAAAGTDSRINILKRSRGGGKKRMPSPH